MDLFVYGSGGEMVMGKGDYIQHSPPLRCDFVTSLPQYGCYFVLCKYHLNR